MIFKKSDLSWFLGLPIYILINSLRHELANMLMVLFTGGRLVQVSILPVFSPGGWLKFGSVQWEGGVEWLILAAPYLCDLVFFTIFAYFTYQKRFKKHWLLLGLVIIGLFSPIFNTGYEYFSSIFVSTDVTRMIDLMLNEEIVHIYFVMTLAFYVLGLNTIIHSSVTAKYEQNQAKSEKRRIREIKRALKESKKEITLNSKMVQNEENKPSLKA